MYYYKVSKSKKTGKALTRLLHRIQKAERARETFLSKIGAEGYQDDESMMVGRVLCVSFPDDSKVDERQWRKVHKDTDGVQMYIPNVEFRIGYVALDKSGERPFDTANRVYSPGTVSYSQVRDFLSDEEKAKYKEGDTLVHYTEYYVKDYPTPVSRKGKYPLWARQIVHIAQQRQKLPVVRVNDLYAVLGAKVTAPKNAKAPMVVTEPMPNFFDLYTRYYIATGRECTNGELEAISQGEYQSARNDLDYILRQTLRESSQENAKRNAK